MDLKRTKGYISCCDRKACGTCRWIEEVGSDTHEYIKWDYCTKIEPNFEVLPGDTCDEWEQKIKK